MQFFAFDPHYTPITSVETGIVKTGLGELLKECGFTNQMKLELFAVERNEIMMRIENIADLHDIQHQSKTSYVNVVLLASKLYEIANGYQISPKLVDLVETSLTGN